MSRWRDWMFALGGLFWVALLAGCNYKGEEPVKEANFAVSSQIKNAIGAAGSTFVNPIMTRWIGTYQTAHPATQINYRPIGSAAGLNELK